MKMDKRIENLDNLLEFLEEILGQGISYELKKPEVEQKSVKEAPKYKAPKIKTEVNNSEYNEFILPKVAGSVLTTDTLKIRFAHYKDGKAVVGVTEKDLLNILAYRNQNNKERTDLYNALIKTYQA